jgi:hypothetical protein
MPASQRQVSSRRPSVFVCPRSLGARCRQFPHPLSHTKRSCLTELEESSARETIWHTPLVGMDKWAACPACVLSPTLCPLRPSGKANSHKRGGGRTLSFPSAYAQFGFAFQRVVSCCSVCSECHALFTVRNMHLVSETSSRNCYYFWKLTGPPCFIDLHPARQCYQHFMHAQEPIFALYLLKSIFGCEREREKALPPGFMETSFAHQPETHRAHIHLDEMRLAAASLCKAHTQYRTTISGIIYGAGWEAVKAQSRQPARRI